MKGIRRKLHNCTRRKWTLLEWKDSFCWLCLFRHFPEEEEAVNAAFLGMFTLSSEGRHGVVVGSKVKLSCGAAMEYEERVF